MLLYGAAADGRVADLLAAASDRASASAWSGADLRRQIKDTANSAVPLWPFEVFLLGEICLLRADHARAARLFQRLLDWSARDPFGDGWGANPLVAIAIWRLLQIFDRHPQVFAELAETNAPTATAFVTQVLRLLETRLVAGMYAHHLLGWLPQIQEDSWRLLTKFARNRERDVDPRRARQLFINYLSLASTPELDEVGRALMTELRDSGYSVDRVELLRGKRLYDLRRHEDAERVLAPLRDSDDLPVRAEAGFYLAKLLRIRERPQREIIDLLSSVIDEAADPEVAQEALFYRGITANRAGRDRDVRRFEQDMETIISDFPHGARADDAIYQLARMAEEDGDLERALAHYGRLQALEAPHDWESTAYFRPAFLLYTRGGPTDLERARKLFENLLARHPLGDLRLNTIFWLARVNEQLGATDRAREHFESLTALSPFDYYAIRARMHLNSDGAASALWPDAPTMSALRDAFTGEHGAAAAATGSVYERLINDAVASGLYRAALERAQALRRAHPEQRPADLTLEMLAGSAFAGVAALTALRQTALAAFDGAGSAGNRLRVAATLSRSAKDHTAALYLLVARARAAKLTAALQQQPAYLDTAYPPVFKERIMQAAAAHGVPAALLYSVIRRESLFNPTALSPRGALGLMQFTPRTFDTLDERYGVLRNSGIGTRAEYLMTPARAIELGALWFEVELLERRNGDLLAAIMEHNAGWPAVKRWRAYWQAADRQDDIEFQIETIGYAETREFARQVLADTILVTAGGRLQ